jgi:hypothetical protein
LKRHNNVLTEKDHEIFEVPGVYEKRLIIFCGKLAGINLDS